MWNSSVKKLVRSWALVARTCILAIREVEIRRIHGLKPAPANSSQGPTLKIPITKKGWWSGSRLAPEFKPPYHQKKKRGHLSLPYNPPKNC
jgi:hypothetical protein